jgi:hypothetical protein
MWKRRRLNASLPCGKRRSDALSSLITTSNRLGSKDLWSAA